MDQDSSRARRAPWLCASLRGLDFAVLPGEVGAALALAAIAIPGQLATARLAGMPPAAGLFAFAAGTLAFAALGRHRFLSVGADSTIAPIMAGHSPAWSGPGPNLMPGWPARSPSSSAPGC
jgi:sulfate permease, SulP family